MEYIKKYELSPTDRSKSFHYNAIVVIDKARNETLYSYDTAVIKRTKSGEIVRLWGGWSATTGKHITAFCGLNKSEFMKLEHKSTPAEKAAAYSGTLYI